MEYKEKYEQALKVAQETYNTQPMYREWLEKMFSELSESEDEKIRKEILSFCQNRADNYPNDPKYANIGNWIAWLEKQGEQKSIWHNEDEEPQRDSLILLIMQSGTPIVAKIIEPNHTFNHGERWAYIDDLLEKQDKQKPIEIISAEESLGIDSDTYDKIIDECIYGDDKVEPKFKVKYAGSEYNVFETKDIAGVTFYGIEDEPNHIDYVKADNCEIINGGYGIKENGCSFPTKPIMFSEQKPTDEEMKIILRTEYEKGRADAIAEMQMEWSEEDEKNLTSCIEAIDACYKWDRMIDWLKSLKGRVQPKQEWNEKDKDYYDAIIAKLEVTQEDAALTDNQMNFLKSLRPQNRWKPSDEQIETLELIINSHSLDAYHLGIVQHLYNDLKKLKEGKV